MLPAVLAVLGGACMGTYPVFVKTPAMRAANIHPFVFQGYKSLWVFVVGIALVAWRAASGISPAYVFTPWAVASACAWVPAGFSLIAAIPRIGVGTAVLIFDSTTTLVSFFTFWLVFHEPIKSHTLPNGYVFYMAPLYMLSALVGMAALVILPARFAETAKLAEPLLVSTEEAGASAGMRSRTAAGYAFAVLAGLCSATQFGLVTIGKRVAASEGVPAEALDPLGSWTASFGIGSVLINAIFLAVVCSSATPPKLQPSVTIVPGSAAGLFYCASMVLTTLAVQLGGNAVIMAQRNAMSLVVSGAWGVLWYREIRGRALAAWVFAALVTVTSVMALGFEKLAPH